MCKCNISVSHFLILTNYRTTKDKKFYPYSCQYVQQPWLLKGCASTVADILDMIWISIPNFCLLTHENNLPIKIFLLKTLAAIQVYCNSAAKQPYTKQITINSICKHVSFNTSSLCWICPMIYLHLLYLSLWRLALSQSTSDLIFFSHGSEY